MRIKKWGIPFFGGSGKGGLIPFQLVSFKRTMGIICGEFDGNRLQKWQEVIERELIEEISVVREGARDDLETSSLGAGR